MGPGMFDGLDRAFTIMFVLSIVGLLALTVMGGGLLALIVWAISHLQWV